MKKQQSPQDILNEILLRMNYDSSKTLSENEKLLKEQSSYAYGSNVGSWMNATEKQGGANDPYEYKKEAGTYYYRKKGSTTNWIATTGTQANAIATKIFGDREPFVVTKPTQNQDPNVYPGPRKTTLSSYSSGDDGQDSDLVNSSQFPQYKYKETDSKRQLQSNYYYDLKNKAYQKITELLKDQNITKGSLQTAWNEFIFNYKMLYRDKDQWEDYRTLVNLINKSKNFSIKNGKIENKSKPSSSNLFTTSGFPKLNLPSEEEIRNEMIISMWKVSKLSMKQKEFEEWEKKFATSMGVSIDEFRKIVEKEETALRKKIDGFFGKPEPLKPVKPRKIEKGDSCGDMLYTNDNPPVWYYKSPKGDRGNCWLRSQTTEVFDLYDEDYVFWEQEWPLWNMANPSISNLEYVKSKMPWIDEILLPPLKDYQDVRYQRDAFAADRIMIQKNMYSATLTKIYEKYGLVEDDPSLIWELFLEFREFWNQTGTQVLATAVSMTAGETGGISALAGFFIEIGVDLMVFFIDLIDCLNNFNDEDAWTRLSEDLQVITFYGTFGLLFRGLQSVAKSKTAKTFGQALKQIGNKFLTWVEPFMNWIIKKCQSFKTKFPKLSGAMDWIINKCREFMRVVRSWLSGTFGAIAPAFVFTYLPITYATFTIFALSEPAVKSAIGPMVEETLGITIDRLKQISMGLSAPTAQEETKLRNIIIPEELEQQVITTLVSNQKTQKQQDVKNKISDNIIKINQKIDDLKNDPQLIELLKERIRLMKGPCKDYFTHLQEKGKIKAYFLTNDKLIVAYDLQGIKGYQVDFTYTETEGKISTVQDANKNQIDCASEDKKLLGTKN